MKHKIAVGDTFYVLSGYDRNVRAMQYLEINVTGEDEKAFHTKRGTINKRSGRFRYNWSKATEGLYTYEEVAQKEWVEANGYKLRQALERVKDYDVLIQIAELIDYEIVPVELNIKQEND
jgi:hypothetical protein